MKNTILNNLRRILFYSATAVVLAACGTDVKMDFPPGPEGPAGKSAYEVWVDDVNDGTVDWPKDQTDINNYFLFLKGNDGKNGVDGKSAYQLWVAEVEKGIDNPFDPGTEWPKDQTEVNNFWLFLTGAKGQNGGTPFIGANNNWWIGDEDLKVPATGKTGADGVSPDITINKEGYWVIDGVATDHLARATDGANGASAYELWKAELAAGRLPAKNGISWAQDQNTINDFWEYLTGKNGEDGNIGVIQPQPRPGYYNVIAQYSVVEKKEYVIWKTGNVIYRVYGTKNNKLGAGVKVKISGLVDPTVIYTTDNNSEIEIPNSQLPETGLNDYLVVKSQVYVDEDNDGTLEWVDTWENTYVPYKIQVRLRIVSAYYHANTYVDWPNAANIEFVVERSTVKSPTWTRVPSYLGDMVVAPIIWPVDASGVKGTPLTVDQKDGVDRMNIATESVIRYRRKSLSNSFVDLTKVLLPEYCWTESLDTKRFYALGIEDACYGQKIVASTLVEDRPNQPMPMPSEFELTGIGGGVYTVGVAYPADVVSQINMNLLFKQYFAPNSSISVSGFTECLSPVNVEFTADDMLNAPFIRYKFVSGNGDTQSYRENVGGAQLSSKLLIDNVVSPFEIEYRAVDPSIGNVIIQQNFQGYTIGTISVSGSTPLLTPRPAILKQPTVSGN